MYTGEKKSSNSRHYHLRKFLRLPLNQQDGEDLKEEAYIQCIKQLNLNPDAEKLDRAWSALALLASYYLPNSSSNRLYYSVLNHLFYFSKMNDNNPRVVQRCEYVYSRLYHTSLVYRTETPSKQEMEFVEQMKPISIPIYLFSGESLYVEFESYNTIKEVKEVLMEKLGLNPQRYMYYGLFEICESENETQERFLDESRLLVDTLSIWEQIQDSANADFAKPAKKYDFKIYLRIKYYYQIGEDDIDSIAMLYYQSLYNFLRGRYCLEEKVIALLAALKLLIEYSIKNDEAYENLNKNLEAYIPSDIINTNAPSFWIQKVMEYYSNFKDYDKRDAQNNFIKLIAKDIAWDAYQVIVKVTYTKCFYFIYRIKSFISLAYCFINNKLFLNILVLSILI